jgi:hypothetical protein
MKKVLPSEHPWRAGPRWIFLIGRIGSCLSGVADSPHLYRILGEFDNKLIRRSGFAV